MKKVFYLICAILASGTILLSCSNEFDKYRIDSSIAINDTDTQIIEKHNDIVDSFGDWYYEGIGREELIEGLRDFAIEFTLYSDFIDSCYSEISKETRKLINQKFKKISEILENDVKKFDIRKSEYLD